MLPEHYKHVDPKSVTVGRVYGIIFVLLLGGLFTIPYFAVEDFQWEYLAVLWFVFFVAAIHIPARRHQHYGYRLGENGLWIRRGMLFHSETYIPRDRLQHTDINQGPLQRYFGIATLVIFTAGVQGAIIQLHGLTHSIAVELRNELNQDADKQNAVEG